MFRNSMNEPYFKKGVLLLNVGTPEHPEINSIKKFLKEFLMDPRVINFPYIYRWSILNFLITYAQNCQLCSNKFLAS